MDLIIGAAINYGHIEINNFIKSFRRFNSSAKIILLTSHLDDSTSEFFKDNNVDFFPVFFNPLTWSKLVNKRFLIIESIIKSSLLNIDRILITDVRDVVFQGDPFKYNDESVCFALEDKAHTLGMNKDMFGIKRFCSDEIIEYLNDFPIICCGTIIGPKLEILKFLDVYRNVYHFYKLHPNFNESTEASDQGLVNLVARLPNLNNVFKSIFLDSGNRIFTMGLSIINSIDNIQISENLILFNGDSPDILHQYDRSAVINDFINDLYK